MSTIIHRACVVCGKDNRHKSDSKYSKNEWKIKKCSACRFVYLENAPVYELLIKDFAWEKTSGTEKAERKKREPFKQAISDYLKIIRKRYLKRDKLPKLINLHFNAGNVLDIGCGAGGILNNLGSKYIPFGVEISEYLSVIGNDILREKGGSILHSDALSGTANFKKKFFEGIIMSAFLEHEIEPVTLLNECFRVLKDNGKVIIKVPNYNSINRAIRGSKWCGFRYPDHVNYFTPKSLLAIVKEVGFSVHQFDFFDKHPLSDNMWMVAVKDRMR